MSKLYRADEWHEDLGAVLWWSFPIEEAPYVGSPLDCGYTTKVVAYDGAGMQVGEMHVLVGGWPGYHTHFTLIEMPAIEKCYE